MRLKHLFDLLCILLGNTLLEHLRERLDKLFGLNTKQIAVSKKELSHLGKGRKEDRGRKWTTDTYLNESEVRHDCLDLFDDLRLGTSVERLEFHIEYRLFLRLSSLLHYLVRSCGTRTGRNRRTRCRECNLLDIQTRLEVIIKQLFFYPCELCSPLP